METTLLRLGNIKEANDILTKALNNVENVSSDIDLVAAYVAKAEVNIKLGNYEKAIEDCDKALKLKNLYSNYYLLEKCKSLYFRIVANYKLNLSNKCKKDFYEFSLEAKKLLKNLKGIKIDDRFLFNSNDGHFDNIDDSIQEFKHFLSNFTNLDIVL